MMATEQDLIDLLKEIQDSLARIAEKISEIPNTKETDKNGIL